jgi:hypothetical protein
LVTLNPATASFAVLLGKDSGAYEPELDSYAASHAIAFAIGAVDADPYPDVVVAGRDYASVTVAYGTGDGTFNPTVSKSLAARPSDVIVADMDGDGMLEVVVVSEESSSVLVVESDGDRSLSNVRSFATGEGAKRVATGDLNGDGNTDLVTANATSLSVLFNDGSGQFNTRTDYPGITGLLSVIDFDRDGNLDLVVSDLGIWILLGAGDGTFSCVEQFALGGDVGLVRLGDLNGDDRTDIVSTTEYGVEVFLNSPR